MSTTKKQLLEAVAAHKAGRSAWARGVHAYAVELVESLEDGADLCTDEILWKSLLNGADNWRQYSEGGAATENRTALSVKTPCLAEGGGGGRADRGL